MTNPEFQKFPKIARFSRECIITEKIDGTNAQIRIEQDGTFLTGSRTRWITPENDNFGFSRWAHDNKDAIVEQLGVGTHFGEWWGHGIQRHYGMSTRVFSLFNVNLWELPAKCGDLTVCRVVPVLWRGQFDEVNDSVSCSMAYLARYGSKAAPGFMQPEGIVVYHTANGSAFKKTFEKDEGKS